MKSMEANRKLTAAVAWNLRKESRRQPPLVIPEAVKKAAEARGWKFRSSSLKVV